MGFPAASVATQGKTVRAILWLTLLSFASPAAGMAADVALAWCFGASAVVDSFRIGVILSVIAQQIFVVAVLPNVVVPVLAQHGRRGTLEEGRQMIGNLGWVLSIPTGALTLILYCHPGLGVTALGPGLMGATRHDAVVCMRYMTLSLVPILWSGIWTGVLYFHEIFWVAPAAQLAANIVFVAIVATLRGSSASGLTAALLAGNVVSVALTWGAVRVLLPRRVAQRQVRQTFELGDTLHLAWPLIAGALVAQSVGVVVNRQLSSLPEGHLAAFGFSWKLLQIILVPTIAISTVLFPQLAFNSPVRFGQQGMTPDAGVRCLALLVFLLIPVSCVLFVAREPLVAILFRHGAFDVDAVRITARLFGILLLGAPAAAVALFLSKICYAAQDTQSPTVVQAVSTGIFALLAPFCATQCGDLGLAGLLSGLSWAICVGLVIHPIARRHFRGLSIVGRVGVSTTAMTAVSLCVGTATSRFIGAHGGLGPGGRSIMSAAVVFVIFVTLCTRSRLVEAAAIRRYVAAQGSAFFRWGSERARQETG